MGIVQPCCSNIIKVLRYLKILGGLGESGLDVFENLMSIVGQVLLENRVTVQAVLIARFPAFYNYCCQSISNN